MFNIVRKEVQFGDRTLILETGRIGRQAHTVMAQMGDTVVICAVVGAKEAKEGIDFFPLTVNYNEKFYAAGRFPGGFIKRGGRPTERETLISRVIDRPIRPLFPAGFYNEVQVTCTVVSYDAENQPDIVALVGASAALSISGIPFEGPVGAARVGYINDEYVLNPSSELCATGLLDLSVAGTKDAVLMVESEAKELSEEVMLGAVMFGHKAFQPVIKAIKEMAKEVGNAAWDPVIQDNSDIVKTINAMVGKDLAKAYKIQQKQSRVSAIDELKAKVKAELVEAKEMDAQKVTSSFKALQSNIVRELMLSDRVRIDGRGPEDIRPILAEIDVLPRPHGSALFTRGETQALGVVTLGSGDDEQLVDDLESLRKDRFMLFYNFPPYSVGETGPMRAPGRREIGHGKLAFRALNAMVPSKEKFPYTIGLVSEITESNGSSSMASVCVGSLAMMAAGVPMPAPVAGIAMGLIKEKERFVVLSDIMGDEDHLGDMDFKVAGTEKGITALQMDIKIQGITEEIMEQALTQAQKGRYHILGKMAEAITTSRSNLSKFAPQIMSIQIPKEKIGELIGPGGKVIKDIIEKTQVKIDINDDGIVNIASTSGEAMEAALAMVNDITAVPEIGKTYTGRVVKITDFGAFVSIMKNCEGLVHVSEMAHTRVRHPKDVVSEGQVVTVKVLGIEKGKVKLSMKALEEAPGADADAVIADDVPFDEKPEAIESTEHQGERRSRDGGKKKMIKRHSHERGERSERGPDRANDEEGRRDRDDRRDDRRGGGGNKQQDGKKRRFF